jgi:preprotein translocase subunit YajC
MNPPILSVGKVIMQRILISVASLLLVAAPASPALAQAATAQADAFAVGTIVTDAKGGPVGTVKSVNGDVVTVRTDKLDANLAKASFTPSGGKLLIGMTQAELNAAVEKDQAAAAASLAVGAEVKGTGGAVLGTIDAIDTEFVTIKLSSGNKVRIPRTGVVGSSTGAVVGLTAEQLEAQVSATAQPNAPAEAQ